MDTVSPEKRSEIMSHIRGENTLLEISLRKYLFSNGFRYRIHVKNLPGRPDIVLPKYKSVIFVHGCFWHQHEGCKIGKIPKTRTQFWNEKFQKNKERDKKNIDDLLKAGWKVLVVWECELLKRNTKKFDEIIQWITSNVNSE